MNETIDPRLARARVPDAHYRVVVVGGGINGAGLFRDLCLQGVDTLLIDSGDFCAGASAGPSRLIHGGIKYLETGEFRLVRQSTLERNLLLKNAPHYVKPIETVLPIQSWFGGIVPSAIRFFGGNAKIRDRGVLITKVGLAMFDFYGRRHRVMPRHSVALRGGTRKAFPDLARHNNATATYYDARITHAERLGLELLLDGMAAHGPSLALNHVALDGREGATLVLRDRVDGRRHRVRADMVINAAGAWIDRVNAALDVPTAYIGGAKGSHLILDNPRLYRALDGKMIYFGVSDGRVGLLYPFMGKVLVGSTDVPIDDPDAAICDDGERDYMLGMLSEVFPDIPVGPEQIVYAYSGIRPLPRAEGGDTSSVSRDHSIRADTLPGTEVPLLSMIGGKWTTFRGFAEEAADRVLNHLSVPRRIGTALLPIGGGKDFPSAAVDREAMLDRLGSTGLPRDRLETLLDRYGTGAAPIAAWCAERQDRPLASLPDYGRAEIAYLLTHECVGRLADVLFRRTDIALSGRLTPAVAAEVASIAGAVLGWDSAKAAAELADCSGVATVRHGLAPLVSRPEELVA